MIFYICTNINIYILSWYFEKAILKELIDLCKSHFDNFYANRNYRLYVKLLKYIHNNLKLEIASEITKVLGNWNVRYIVFTDYFMNF